MRWKKINLNPLQKQTGDCVIRAIAYATGQSWDSVFRELTEEAYNRAEMPSWNPTWWAYLERKGFTRHVIPEKCPECYTVKDFCREYPHGTYVLFIPQTEGGVGHVVAVQDGSYIDTWDSGNEIPLVFWERR